MFDTSWINANQVKNGVLTAGVVGLLYMGLKMLSGKTSGAVSTAASTAADVIK